MRAWLLIFFAGAVLSKPNKNLQALWNFEEVTECVLHYRALVYNNYGCWCGVGGSHEPVDGIDECCMHHDKCYDAAVDTKKCFDVAWEYVDNYSWNCTNSNAVCTGNQEDCKAALCECDTTVVACWAKYEKPSTKPKCNRSNWTPPSKFFQH